MQKRPEHSPAPDPERAIYGFFLLILSIIFLFLYIILSYLPYEWLNNIGLTYLPQKYWYIALPSYIVVAAIYVLSIYTVINMQMVNNYNSFNNIKDEASVYKHNHHQQHHLNSNDNNAASIPPVSDIPLTKICQILYLEPKTN